LKLLTLNNFSWFRKNSRRKGWLHLFETIPINHIRYYAFSRSSNQVFSGSYNRFIQISLPYSKLLILSISNQQINFAFQVQQNIRKKRAYGYSWTWLPSRYRIRHFWWRLSFLAAFILIQQLSVSCFKKYSLTTNHKPLLLLDITNRGQLVLFNSSFWVGGMIKEDTLEQWAVCSALF